ncbi:hypothetical protein [Hansschlegelia sp.]|uniref:hypothetical protein n=1 Tax=Hansschlegelia sp. TaxID=2041892 RepID=UPI002CD74C9F|nr:hypothetical protein [Hansschlegelia sp.]HVI30098.1 hypothetical protein [Hansschlegelia sp.]
MSETALVAFIRDELNRPVAPAVRAFAAEIAARGRGGVAAVLFYGSALRTGELDGLLDFYVLLDDPAAWDWRAPARAGARVLPPNIEYAEHDAGDAKLRAKIAIMTLAQFRDHARAQSLDTTIWARFAQPVAVVYARDAVAAEAATQAVAGAVRGAAWWAARLGPEQGRGDDFWRELFRRTYASELRVEGAGRAGSIVDTAPERYAAVLPLAWAADGLAFAQGPGEALAPALTASQRADAERAWRRRKRIAKPLNLARLAKAAFTFSGGVDYLAWKIERHSGHRVEVTPFQRRHPLLAAGPALWRLWRKGVLR